MCVCVGRGGGGCACSVNIIIDSEIPSFVSSEYFEGCDTLVCSCLCASTCLCVHGVSTPPHLVIHVCVCACVCVFVHVRPCALECMHA